MEGLPRAGGLEEIGKMVLVAGLIIAVIGLLLLAVGRLGWSLRPLPGDIVVRRPGLVFYFPLATMLLISVVLTVIMYLVSRFRH